jgi:hypothetical protein
MDNKILYTAKFTHHDLKFHKVWWKSEKRCGSWSGQTDRQADSYILYMYNNQQMCVNTIMKGQNTIKLIRNQKEHTHTSATQVL